MDIILYEGSHLDDADLRSMAQSAVSMNCVDDVDLNLRVCATPEALSNAMRELALREVQDRERFFPFKAVEGTKLLRLSQVLYFKSSGHRVIAMLTDGTELHGRTVRVSTASLLEPLIRTGKFYRTYRSTFINKTHVVQLGPAWVLLDDGTRLSVSRKYYNQLLDQGKLKGM